MLATLTDTLVPLFADYLYVGGGLITLLVVVLLVLLIVRR